MASAVEPTTVALGQAIHDIGKTNYPIHIMKYSARRGMITYCKDEPAQRTRRGAPVRAAGCSKCKRMWKENHSV